MCVLIDYSQLIDFPSIWLVFIFEASNNPLIPKPQKRYSVYAYS